MDTSPEALKQIILDAHAELDKAGVVSADHTICTDPTCQSTLVHRIRILVRLLEAKK